MKFRKIVTIGIDRTSLDDNYWKRIDSLTGKRVDLAKDSIDIKKNLKDADCILVNPFVFKVDSSVIDMASKLKYIGVLSTAYGKVDVDYAKSKGVTVCNVPGYSTEAVAEFVFAIILENIRQLGRGKKRANEGNYSEAGFAPFEIKDKPFGIIGLGRIGNRVAEIAKGFGANVKYWSKNRKREIESNGATYADIDDLLSECDFVSLHLSQNKDTENFLDGKRIQKIKKNAIVVNTAPMELVDIDALEKRLEKNDMTFILDHSDEMSEDDLMRLSKFENCVIYPPIAYVTKEAYAAKQRIFIQNIENFLKGSPINKVN